MKRILIALTALLVITACQTVGITDDPKVLNRPKAEAIIKRLPNFHRQIMIKFALQPKNLQILVVQHLGYMEKDKLALTERGRQLWRDWGYQVDKDIVPVARAQFVEVTGINRTGTSAAVQFTWKWETNEIGKALMIGSPEFFALPDDLQNKIRQPVPGATYAFQLPNSGITYGGVHKGTSNFDLFDDGWRASDLFMF